MRKIFLRTLFIIFSGVPVWSAEVTGEYIVKLKSASMPIALKTLKAGSIKSLSGRNKIYLVKIKNKTELDELKASADYEVLEPNYTVSTDPVSITGEEAASIPATQVIESWVVSKAVDKGPRPIVAVVDSGIDPNHSVFVDSEALWENEKEKMGLPGVDDDQNGYVDDVSGWNFILDSGTLTDESRHGTHVSGIVLSAGQDILLPSLQRSKIRIMPLKFLNGSGVGTTADGIQAIYYAVDNGADVINNSWGGSNYSKALADAYEYAARNGVLITSAAGNYGSNNDELSMYPANYASATNISVMATNNDDTKPGFSNFGAKSVSVAAPGVSVVSSVPGDCNGSCFGRMSGTSMAAPFVAGMAAMAKREAPFVTALKLKEIILDSSDLVPSLAGSSVTGGRVNALKSILKAQNEVESDTQSEVTSFPKLTDSSSGGGCGLIAAKEIAIQKKLSQKPREKILFVILFLMPLIVALALRRYRLFINFYL